MRCRVPSGCHGGRRRVGRSCLPNWGKSLKPRKKWLHQEVAQPGWLGVVGKCAEAPREGQCPRRRAPGKGPGRASASLGRARQVAEPRKAGVPRELLIVLLASPAWAAGPGHCAGALDAAGRGFARSGPGGALARGDVVLARGPGLRLGPVPGAGRGQPGFAQRPDFKLHEGHADGGHGGSGRIA